MIEVVPEFLEQPTFDFDDHAGRVFTCRMRFRSGKGGCVLPLAGLHSGLGLDGDGLPLWFDLFAWELRAVPALMDDVVRRWRKVEDRDGHLDERRALTLPRLEKILAGVSQAVAGLSPMDQVATAARAG